MNGRDELRRLARELAEDVLSSEPAAPVFDTASALLALLRRVDDAPGTVEVRIAVIVGKSGNWAANGRAQQFGWEPPEAILLRSFPSDARLSWVTARVPMPVEPATVEGEVSDAG